MTGVFRGLASLILPAAIQRQLRTVLRSSRQRRFIPRIVTRRYGCLEVVVRLIDAKGTDWYDHDRDFEPELNLLSAGRLRQGSLVFNLGAHQGIVAVALATLVGPSGRVIALEANPKDAEAAQKNGLLNRCHNLTVLNAAIADRPGSVTFATKGSVATNDNSEPSVSVRATTIDDLALEYGVPDVLFIDVDGYEAHALRGASHVLSCAPDCYVEIHGHLLPAYGESAVEVMHVLQKHYRDIRASSDMRPESRRFAPLAETSLDPRRAFHVVAAATVHAALPSDKT